MGRRFYQEPLTHFVFLGILIFGINALLGEPTETRSNRIVVSAGQVERITNLWLQNWNRVPSDAELQALIGDYIKEEIYYREALKLGLDKDDLIVRRRLRQKMEFLATATVEKIQADKTTLLKYLADNAARYKIGPLYDFEQVYFQSHRLGDLQSALAELREGRKNAEQSGDTINLPTIVEGADAAEVTRIFGTVFYDALSSIEPGIWHGPLQSGFGIHIVKINSLVSARIPNLEEVRPSVEIDWQADQIQTEEKAAYEQLRDKYRVEVELPR